MTFSDNDRLTVLLDDLTHELRRLNDNLEQIDDPEVSIGENHR